MRRFLLLLTGALCGLSLAAAPRPFDPASGTPGRLTLPDGRTVPFTAYEKIYYVSNVEDSVYQYLNIYVPGNADSRSPMLLKTYVGGYMASAAGAPRADDATGRALAEGMVVVIPGCRGRNSVVTVQGRQRFDGKAPAAILDLKAAVRYLRANDGRIPGDAERIVTDGTSAGGALSALLGATGNHPDYAAGLAAMGACDARDDVFAAVCFCPIIDLEHADMAYEWLYCAANDGRGLSSAQEAVSEQLMRDFSAYLHELQVKDPEDGAIVTESNYIDFVGRYIMEAAGRALADGAVLPEGAGFTLTDGRISFFDTEKYMRWLAAAVRLKSPPAFDAMDVAGGRISPENDLFGGADGVAAHFTDFGLQQTTGGKDAHIPADMTARVRMMNPMSYLTDAHAVKAPHWYIRHGSRDRDTAFTVPVNLFAKLAEFRYDTDFRIEWGQPHRGDYDLDGLFAWIKGLE